MLKEPLLNLSAVQIETVISSSWEYLHLVIIWQSAAQQMRKSSLPNNPSELLAQTIAHYHEQVNSVIQAAGVTWQ